MEAREIQQTKAKNDLDDMHAAATKLAHAHKKLCLRRALTQVRHPVAESRLTASRVLKSGACSSRAFVSCLIAGERVRDRRASVFNNGIKSIQAARKDDLACRAARRSTRA